MIEVEVKLPLYRRSLTEKALLNLGFEAGDLVRESDLYFNSDFHDFIKRDEALRIRTCENLTQRTCQVFLTYKGRKLDSVSMTRKELETSIGDGKIGMEILKSLGYDKTFPVNKLRQLYHKDHITACVDQVEKLGSFLELEVLIDQESERERALEQIREILEAAGSSMDETTRVSYLGMLMRKSGEYSGSIE